MADVFISYHVSPGTSALVRNIADELESMGISCWYAPRNVTPGAFVPSILDAIACCKAFLMILDEGANGPGYVYNEMLQAFNRFKLERQPEIIPFKLGTFTTIPDIAFYLAPFHMFDGGASAETAHTEELIHKISALFHKTLPPKIVKRGKCGDSVTFTLDENGILTISGDGSIWHFHAPFITDADHTPWWEEHRTIMKAKIQNGVTEIGMGTFSECTGLINVTIPDSVTEIHMWAFAGCTSLISITIPDSVTVIHGLTFYGCKGLASVTIPDSVKLIGKWAFRGCKNLTSLTIPDTTMIIRKEAFLGCTGLTNVSVPKYAGIQENAFPANVCITRRE